MYMYVSMSVYMVGQATVKNVCQEPVGVAYMYMYLWEIVKNRSPKNLSANSWPTVLGKSVGHLSANMQSAKCW